MKRPILISLLFLIVFATLSSCNRDDYEFDKIPVESRLGKLNLVEGSGLNYSDLEILSFAGSSDFDDAGNFSLDATVPENFQQLMVVSKETENPVYVGLYDPVTRRVMVNDTSTVLAFMLANPHLLNTTYDQRLQYLNSAKKNQKFPQLITLFRQTVKNDAETVFDVESNPVFFQSAVEIMKESIESLQSGSKSQYGEMFGGEPSIEDVAGDDIVFVNPRHVFYGAGIYDAGEPTKILNTVTVKRQGGIIQFNWDLNKLVTWNDPARTNYTLKDGQFRIYLTRGMDFTKIMQWDDPVGRSTLCNTGQIIIYTIDIITGFKPSPNWQSLAKYINISTTRIYGFTRAVQTKNLFGFVSSFAGLMADNAEGLIKWAYASGIKEGGKAAAAKSLKSFAKICGGLNTGFKLVSMANGPGPMFYDLLFAPEELNFMITQKNGVITTSKENLQPEAKFKITPPAGIIGTKFQFDASETTDDIDNISQLKFRWDFDSDGTWDTEWTNNLTISHSFTESSSYTVTLSAKDSDGLIGMTSHTLNVGGGAGTASHVKLFMDKNPWSSDAMIRMLKANGFSEGTGKNTYEIIKSTGMSGVPLIPGEDLVIISNDQEQNFYNNYAASQIRFTNFVNNGGALLWEACDKGWNLGSMATAGLSLPGNVKSNYRLDYYNYVTDTNLPLVATLPQKMDHNYASHEFFTDLPDGTTIYCTDSNNNPTLIEFNFGDGWIIITGQPLEHQFDRVYGAVDMGKLLPGIVSYFTGSNSPKHIEVPAGTIRDNKSSTAVD